MKLRTLAALAIATPFLALTPSGAAHAAGTCQGLPATIESSSPGATLTGTEGADVILASNTATINALGGDDVICAAGGMLDAGAGNDSVSVTNTGNANLQDAVLGSGTNHYVSTGQMLDSVTSGTPDGPDHDVIDLGGGTDGLTILPTVGSAVTAAGGTEGAQLIVRSVPGDTSSWALQLPATVTRDGASIGSFTDFHAALEVGPSASATVHGTDGADTVLVSAGHVDVDLGAGKDYLQLSSYFGGVPTSGHLDLGDGKDSLSMDSEGPLVVDLRKGTLGDLTVAGLEQSYLSGPRVDYTGTGRNDTAYVLGCRVTMHGGGGNDLLYKAGEDTAPTFPKCHSYRFRIYGGTGNDRMKGWSGDDVLIGGPGRDHAIGVGGTDTCRAEVEKSCER